MSSMEATFLLFIYPLIIFVVDPRRNQNEQLRCFLSCSQERKKGKLEWEKASKKESSGVEETKNGDGAAENINL